MAVTWSLAGPISGSGSLSGETVWNPVLHNTSFETGNAYGCAYWSQWNSFTGSPTEEQSTLGVVSGTYSLRYAYTGLAGDTTGASMMSQKVQEFAQGDPVTGAFYISGSKSGITATIGMVAHSSSDGWLDQYETADIPLTDLPTRWEYVWPSLPANTYDVELYLYIGSVAEGDSFDIRLDGAQLLRTPAEILAGNIASSGELAADLTIDASDEWSLAGDINGAAALSLEITQTQASWSLAGAVAGVGSLSADLITSSSFELAGAIVASGILHGTVQEYPFLMCFQSDGTASQIAEYDLAVMSDRALVGWSVDDDRALAASAKAINPGLICLPYVGACEVAISSSPEVGDYPNAAAKAMSPKWFLLQDGTTITEDLDTTETEISVADTSKFVAGDFINIGDTEIAKVASVGTGVINVVTRGFLNSAVTHASGDSISPICVMFPGTAMCDVSDYCRTADMGYGAERFSTWFPRYIGAHLDSSWDGVCVDRADGDQSWILTTEPTRSIAHITAHSTAEFDASWNAGLFTLLSSIRTAVGDKIILANGAVATAMPYLNGNIFENFPNGFMGEYQRWQEQIIGPNGIPTRDSYLEWDSGSKPPRISTIMVTEAGTSSYAPYRFGLVSALMGSGYYNINSGDRWLDEFDKVGAGKGYLGVPTGTATDVAPALESSDLLGGDGDFDPTSYATWSMVASSPAAATFTNDESLYAKAVVTAVDADLYKCAFATNYVGNIANATAYTIRFRAKTGGGNLRARIDVRSGNQNGYDGTPLQWGYVKITDEWRWYEITTTSILADASDAALYFCLLNVGTYYLDDITIKEGSRDVWQREFQHGIALLNASPVSKTISLDRVYRKLTGTQDPTINDGSFISSITLASEDAVILLAEVPFAGEVTGNGILAASLSKSEAGWPLVGTMVGSGTLSAELIQTDAVWILAGNIASSGQLAASIILSIPISGEINNTSIFESNISQTDALWSLAGNIPVSGVFTSALSQTDASWNLVGEVSGQGLFSANVTHGQALWLLAGAIEGLWVFASDLSHIEASWSLAGGIASSGSVDGSIILEIPINGELVSTGILEASLLQTDAIWLVAGSIAGNSTLGASLTQTDAIWPLAGSISGNSLFESSLIKIEALSNVSGDIYSTVELSGTLSIQDAIWPISGDLTSASSIISNLSINETLAGNIGSSGIFESELNITNAIWDLAGNISSTGSIAADLLQLEAAWPLAATLTGDSTLSASLTKTEAIWSLSGNIASNVSFESSIETSEASWELAGNIQSNSVFDAGLSIGESEWVLVGAVSVAGSLGGAIIAHHPVAGSMSGYGTLSATVSQSEALWAMVGTIESQSLLSDITLSLDSSISFEVNSTGSSNIRRHIGKYL
jgi:hypothetical protein